MTNRPAGLHGHQTERKLAVKRKLMTTGAVVVLLALAGAVLALWLAQTHVDTSITIGGEPAIGIVWARTDDDGVVSDPKFDAADIPGSGDPSGLVLNGPRRSANIGNCVAHQFIADYTADWIVAQGYGDYYCTTAVGLSSSTDTAVGAVRWGTTELSDCPLMASVDTNDNGQPDIELCVAGVDGAVTGPLLGRALPKAQPVMGLVSLHILTTATGNQVISGVVTIEAGFQSAP
jgi:hypothetical protein